MISLCLALALALSPPTPPQASTTVAEARVLVVGTMSMPPFVTQRDGLWGGTSIELWRDIAAELNLRFELQERDVPGLFAGLEDGSLDVAVAALTVTAEREQRVDFTHPFYTTGSRRQEVAMFAVTLLLTAFPTLVTLVASWLIGVAVIASLFTYNHSRIKHDDQHL